MKRILAARTIFGTGLLNFKALGQKDTLNVFCFHRVCQPETVGEFDTSLISASPKKFEEQIKWLSQKAVPLSESDLLDLRASGDSLPKRSVMLTFDDGYIDNYETALPILEKYRVPALFFLPYELIEKRTLGWWDQIAYLVGRASTKNSSQLVRKYQEAFKTLAACETVNLINQISSDLKVELPPPEMQSEQLMSWEQVMELSGRGVSVGSHTLTHRVLSTLNPQEQQMEIEVSKSKLEAKLGLPVHSIAFPVGDQAHFTANSIQFAKNAGYQLIFNLTANFNQTSTDPMINRVNASQSLSLVAAQASYPAVFSRGFQGM